MRRTEVLRATLVAIVAAACGTGGNASSFIVSDSAGVRIAESRAPAWDDEKAWRVGEALVRIGVVVGDPAYQFSDVAGTVRLADGTIVVADGGSQQVRFYGPEGRFLLSSGGPGGGPGEFTGLASLGRSASGAVWAYDFSLRRFTWLDASGRVGRIVPLDPEPPTLSTIGVLPDGSFVMKQLWGSKTSTGEPRTGLQRESTAYVRFDSLGVLADTLGTFPGREVFISIGKGRGVMSSPLFARNSVGVLHRQSLVIGDQQMFRLTTYAVDGTLLSDTRIPDRDLRIKSNEVREHIEFLLESSLPDERLFLERSLESMPVPETRPAHGKLLVDDQDFLWVGEWSQFPGVPRTWTIMSVEGQWLGEVTMPPGFQPHDIGSNWILGTESDGLGVDYIVLYSLVKPTV